MTDNKSYSTLGSEVGEKNLSKVLKGFYEGSLLISTPSILDPRFNKTVIYMLSHNRKGAMGLIINKPMKELDFQELVTGIVSTNTEGRGGQTVFFGGPVEFNRGFLLHSSEYYIPGKTLKLGNNYNLTNDTKALEDVCEGKGPISSVFTLGYSGWYAGQLEREILEDSWLVAQADPSIVFGRNHSEKYDFSLSSIGVNNGYLASKSGRA